MARLGPDTRHAALSALELDIASRAIATEIDRLRHLLLHDARSEVNDPATMDGVRAALERALVQPL